MRGGGFRDSINLSKVTIDTDLNLASHKIICAEVDTDVIAEKTGAAGITLNHRLKADEIQEKTGSAGVSLFSVLKTAALSERVGSGGIALTGFIDPTNPFYVKCSASDNLKLSSDSEKSTISSGYGLGGKTAIKGLAIPSHITDKTGTIRVKCDYKIGAVTDSNQIMLCRNNEVMQTQNGVSETSYTTHTFSDITATGGDTITIEIDGRAGSVHYVQNFRIYFDVAAHVPVI